MRYRLPILLMLKDQSKEPLLDISYQAKMLSLVKKGLSGTNPELFHKMYDENVQKKFAMSVYFPYSKIENKKIILSSDGPNAVLYFSTADNKLALEFYNAFIWLNHQGVFSFDKNLNCKIGKLSIVNEPVILTEKVLIKTMSPLVVRDDNGRFLSCITDDDVNDYNSALKHITSMKLSGSNLCNLVDGLVISPIRTKKTVIKPFDIFIEATTGIFEINGNPTLIDRMIKEGIGEKCGSFAGLCKVMEKV